MQAISQLDPLSRPREKLLRLGPESLTDRELIAAMLGSGTKTLPINELAERVLHAIDEAGGSEIDFERLEGIPGLGPARLCMLAATLEFGLRRIQRSGALVRDAEDVFLRLVSYAERGEERFFCLTLDGSRRLLDLHLVKTRVPGALPTTRQVFAPALADGAASLILAHNPPRGRVRPTKRERDLHAALQCAGEALQLPLTDHMLFAANDFYSFLDFGEEAQLRRFA